MANRRKSAAELQATGALIEHAGRYAGRIMSWEPPATFNDQERQAWESLRDQFPVLDSDQRLTVENLARVLAKPRRTATDAQTIDRALRALHRRAGKAPVAKKVRPPCDFVDWDIFDIVKSRGWFAGTMPPGFAEVYAAWVAAFRARHPDADRLAARLDEMKAATEA